MTRLLVATLLSATLAAGCLVVTRHRAAVVATPDLVYVSPNVQVIADYDEPIFYSGGYYWWYVDGAWYRSSVYTDGWVYVSAPPAVIISIGDPIRYRHYRPHGYVVRQRPAPAETIHRPVVRDHRDERPKVRDHRR